MAPINLPDGTEVSEVILPDGASASEVIAPDGRTVFGGIPDSGIARYEFEQDVTDSFNNNDATNNNVAFSSSTVKQGSFSAEFTASSGENITTPALLPENDSPFSLAGFFRQSSVASMGYINDGDVNISVFDDSNGNLNVKVGGSRVAEFALDTGVFRHLAITFDGSQAEAYYDGTSQGTVSTSTGTAQGLTIGNIAAGGIPFDGFIDLIDIYGKELSSTEVTNHKDTFSING
jgi:hypothetical protein